MTTTIEERLRVLEDRREIEELRATYCFLVDDGRFEDLMRDCFTDDPSCDFRGVRGSDPPVFVANGRDEVRVFFSQMVPAALQDMCHTTHNHRVVVDGDRASGDCYFEVTARHTLTGEPVVGAGRYVDRYRRTDGRWRIERRNAEMYFIAPLGEGWVKRPFVDLQAAVR